MEYGKKDWQRSEGRYRSFGKDSQKTGKPLSAYHPADRSNTSQKRPNEMMTMESSYGGISFGASRDRKMTMVVHEKRRTRGVGLKKDNQEVEGNRTVSLRQLRGDFRTNSHNKEDSAFAYQEELEETPLRMMERLQEMLDKNVQQSGEKVLPFLDRKRETAEKKEIQEQLRNSLEESNAAEYQLWSRRQETFWREHSEKEQLYRNFSKELKFVREKSKRLMKREGTVQNVLSEEQLKSEEEETPKEDEKEE